MPLWNRAFDTEMNENDFILRVKELVNRHNLKRGLPILHRTTNRREVLESVYSI